MDLRAWLDQQAPVSFEEELIALVSELEQQDAVGATVRSMIHIEHQLIGLFDQLLTLINAGGGIKGETRRLDMSDHLDRYCLLAATVMLSVTMARSRKRPK